MGTQTAEENRLLHDAHSKAKRLVASLVAQSQDLEQFAGRIAPETLEQGRHALLKAIDSARRTLAGIEQALGDDAADIVPEDQPNAGN